MSARDGDPAFEAAMTAAVATVPDEIKVAFTVTISKSSAAAGPAAGGGGRAERPKRKAAAGLAALSAPERHKWIDREARRAMSDMKSELRMDLEDQHAIMINVIASKSRKAAEQLVRCKARAGGSKPEPALARRIARLMSRVTNARSEITAEKKRHQLNLTYVSLLPRAKDLLYRKMREEDDDDYARDASAASANPSKRLCREAGSDEETESDEDEADRQLNMEDVKCDNASHESGDAELSPDLDIDNKINDAARDLEYAQEGYDRARRSVAVMVCLVGKTAEKILSESAEDALPIVDVVIPATPIELVRTMTREGKFGHEMSRVEILAFKRLVVYIRRLITGLVEGPTPGMSKGRVAADEVETVWVGVRAALILHENLRKIMRDAGNPACFGPKEGIKYAERITQTRLIASQVNPGLLYSLRPRLRSPGQSNPLDIIFNYESPFFSPETEGLDATAYIDPTSADAASALAARVRTIHETERADARRLRAEVRKLEKDGETFEPSDDPVLNYELLAPKEYAESFDHEIAEPLQAVLGPAEAKAVSESGLDLMRDPALAFYAEQQRLRRALCQEEMDLATLAENVSDRVMTRGFGHGAVVDMTVDDDAADTKAIDPVLERVQALSDIRAMMERAKTNPDAFRTGFSATDLAALRLAIPRMALDLLTRFIRCPDVADLPRPSSSPSLYAAAFTANLFIERDASRQLAELGEENSDDDNDDEMDAAKPRTSMTAKEQDIEMEDAQMRQDARRAVDHAFLKSLLADG